MGSVYSWCHVSARKFMHTYFSFTGLIGWHPITWPRSWFQDGGKISLCVDLRSRNENYSIQVFKTMQGVYGWIGSFVCSPLIAEGFLFQQVLCFIFNFAFQRLWFRVSATLTYVVLLFRHNFMFLHKSTQNIREQILQWLKDATSSSCVQLLAHKISHIGPCD